MTEAHCIAIVDRRVECTCGWRSPYRGGLSWDFGRHGRWHSLAVGETIDNPYLREFLAPVSADEQAECERIYGSLPSGDLFSDLLVPRLRRDRLTAKYAWAIPTELVIRQLAALSPIVDLGCGTGYWAKLLGDVGAKVRAVDANPPLEGNNHWHAAIHGLTRQAVDLQHFVDIEKASVDTFDVPRDHTLFLGWPPYAEAMAANALARYQGDRVIYIGEGGFGCTGDDAFHDMLANDWTETANYDIPQWDGIHDSVRVYERLQRSS